MHIKSRPLSLTMLIVCLLFLGISGLLGGPAMLLDPGGDITHLPQDLSLPSSALFFTLLVGGLPLITARGLWRRSGWAWGTAVAVSTVLCGWVCGQVLLWTMPGALQLVYLALGIFMLLLCLAPALKVDQERPLANVAWSANN